MSHILASRRRRAKLSPFLESLSRGGLREERRRQRQGPRRWQRQGPSQQRQQGPPRGSGYYSRSNTMTKNRSQVQQYVI